MNTDLRDLIRHEEAQKDTKKMCENRIKPQRRDERREKANH